MKKKKIFIITTLLISMILSFSSCDINLNFKNPNNTQNKAVEKREGWTPVDYGNISIQIPEGFVLSDDSDDSPAYFNRDLVETIVLYKDIPLFDDEKICEEEIKDIYDTLDDTKFKTINGMYMAETNWASTNDNGLPIQHITYDFVYKGEIYEITFTNPFAKYSNKEVMETLEFD